MKTRHFFLSFVTLYIIVMLFGASVQAQIEESQTEPMANDVTFKKSFFTGGSLGLQFGTITMVDVSPQFGYYIFENLSVGMGLTYQYVADRRYMPREDMHVLGGRVFSNVYLPIYNSIFAHGEYEYMAYNTNLFNSTGLKEWITVSNVLAGIGYRQRLYGRSAMTLMILWNFNESQYNLYNNPVIRAGVDIGL